MDVNLDDPKEGEALIEIKATGIAGKRTAYSLDFFKENPVFDDVVSGHPITVFFDNQREIAGIFSRDIGVKRLAFELLPESPTFIDLVEDSLETRPIYDRARLSRCERTG